MATDLSSIQEARFIEFKLKISRLSIELSAGNDVTGLEAITEATEEYGPYVAALEEAIEREDENDGAFTAFVDAFGMAIEDASELEDTVQAFDSAYAGTQTMEEYAEEYVESCVEIPDFLRGYIDYEKFARDLELGGDMVENDGHLFHSNW